MTQVVVRMKKPYPPQKAFMRARGRYIAYGGARGGGKSEAARMKAVLLALKNPGVQILFLRRTLTDLRENHLMPLLKLCRVRQFTGISSNPSCFPTVPGSCWGTATRSGTCLNTRDRTMT